MKKIRWFIFNNLLISLVFFGCAWYFSGIHTGLSVLAGAIVMFFNFLILAWACKRLLLDKKSIALAAGVIVSKYAILGAIIYLLFKFAKVETLPFLIGTGALLISVFMLAVQDMVLSADKKQ